MKKHHQVTGLHFDGDCMVLTIDGREKTFRVSELSPVLQNASKKEKILFEVSPSGYGIHWPLLDEDLSIDGLLGVVHRPKKLLLIQNHAILDVSRSRQHEGESSC
ncbi:DUF2442 domain-containing protein [Candidatus Poribacteria bacterium]|nr:DUF2442 domain-containing protein [Candidatus Poribacteria bacterium]MYF90711.1 DUF2442 domain-containing protein [Gemmatimonadota bacterium]MYK40021.1 DUF2442 domain-containing protein [Gemmatimonadota bacterium]